MTTRSRGPGAGFQWLSRGIGAGFRRPKPILGGAAFLALVSLVPALISFGLQYKTFVAHTQPNPATLLWLMPISMLSYLLLMPAYGGYLQVVEAAENGVAARARDIFKPYASGEALRLIGFGLMMMLIYLGAFGVILISVGHGVAGWYMHLIESRAAHQTMTMTLPAHFGATVALIILTGLYIFAVYAISLCQIALNHRSVFGAIGDGVVGALKNVFPLIVMLLSGILAFIVMIIAMFVVILVITLIGKLAGEWLILTLGIAVDVAFILLILMIQFGTMYHLWHDVCDEDPVPGTAESVAA